MKKVLFVCVHNAGRSQMAEAYFNHWSMVKVVAVSAGTEPVRHINPVVAHAMVEDGIDISEQRPKLFTSDMANNADRIITMGCEVGGVCPVILISQEDWGIDDPAGKPIVKVRQIREAIKVRVAALIRELE